MPTYDYHCDTCGDFEVFQNIKDEPLRECPKCGNPVRKLVSKNVNVIYKAPGFYVSDHRSKEYKEKAKEDKEGSSTTSSKPSCSCTAAAS
ncbi:MAG TPA: zinc ribbon domain-containing protein [Firmicutes bacterium]|nr:zinc ribbon domain-containing protein [Bacillota bacterium]